MTTPPATWSELCQRLPPPPAMEAAEAEAAWLSAAEGLGRIVVLDDDPTGVQTVHGVPVFTSWSKAVLRRALSDPSRTVYVLTNSRALTTAQSERLHRQLARNLRLAAADEGEGTDFLLISRSDSTLRGHYPLETRVLNEELGGFDGEIIAPAFPEGGRITYGDVHYVREGDRLTPVGETEFARDPDFGYRSSNLRQWIEEKTGGAVPAERVVSIPLELLRRGEADAVADLLCGLSGFAKAVVNAVDYADLQVFVCGLSMAKARGRRFLCRTAASLVRVAGGIKPRALLAADDLRAGDAAGLIVVGSYTRRTTDQLQRLAGLPELAWLEWRVGEAVSEKRLFAEAHRVAAQIDRALALGKDVCVYTSRDFQNPSGDHLAFGTQVSRGLVRTLKAMTSTPGFIIAKGGITAADIGVKALGVKRATVLGQVLAGVPVWRLGPESRFPGMSYVIFAGNVGGEDALLDVVNTLRRSARRRTR